MHLSQKAKKALAAGLALSTLMWSVSFLALPAAFAAPHSEGCLVLSGGTVYLITGGQRRGFTSAEVFASSGYNFGQVVAANSEDNAIPEGPIMVYADGSLVKGPNDPLVYLVANGQKRGFVSGSVFTGLGYSFANIQWAPVNTFSDLPTGSNVESATERHPAGTWVKDGTGTVWMMTTTGRKGLPTMEVFNSYGKSWATVVAANAADLATNNEGVLGARATCSGGSTPSGSVTVGLASSSPAASTLVAGQALADLAHFSYSGSGSISSLTFERIGVSANTTPANVYLFNGATRVTDAASFGSDNKVTFAGLNISVPATLSVKADIASGTAGQTVGARAVAVNGSAVNVSGSIHTVATATLATLAMSGATDLGSNDPGNDINVFQGTATVGTRDVMLKRFAVRQIGSINASDIKNIRLQVDGNQVAQTSSLDSNGYAVFTPNTALKTGARTVKVVADIIGGSGRTVQFSLRGAYDVESVDTSYNVGVLATGTFPFGDSTASTMNSGTLSVAKASDSPSANVVAGASDVSVGKWSFNAYGEAVKVETLTVGVDTDDTDSTVTMRNVRVLVDGVQVGSTTDVAAVNSYATGQSFTTNFTVTPGVTRTVEVRSDMYDSEGTDEIGAGTLTTPTFALVAGSSNAVPQVSLSAINAPTASVAANQLTIATGSISIAQTSTYPAQSVVVPQTAFKIGSFTVTGNATEAVNVNTLTLNLTLADTDTSGSLTTADVTDVYLKYNGTQTTVKPTVTATSSTTSNGNTYSPNFTIPVNGSVTVDVYATLSSDFTATDTVIASLLVSGTTAGSSTSVSTNSGSVLAGQTITVASGNITATADASTPSASLVDDTGTVTTAIFKFAASTDTYTVTDMTITLGNASAVSSVAIKTDGALVSGSAAKPGSTSLTWSNLNLVVPSNTSKLVAVELTLSPVGVGAGTTDSSLLTTLTSFTSRSSNGTTDVSANDSGQSRENDPAGNAFYVYKAVPLVSAVALPTSALAGGEMVLAKFTVSSNGTGTVAWKQAMFEITKAAAPTISSPTLYNSDTGEQITAATSFQNGTSGVATTCVADNTFCELLVTVGTVADDDTVQSVNGAKTYEIRATIGGTLASGNFVTTKLDRNTTSHAASAVFTTNDNAGTAGSTAFTWSDESNASTGDTGVATWQKDYLVKNLPLTWTLNRN